MDEDGEGGVVGGHGMLVGVSLMWVGRLGDGMLMLRVGVLLIEDGNAKTWKFKRRHCIYTPRFQPSGAYPAIHPLSSVKGAPQHQDRIVTSSPPPPKTAVPSRHPRVC